jgi:D-beta-D-heptose 7-phosphate kinase/D-beta-D-heptose 1-phosphate adenosyltransferase
LQREFSVLSLPRPGGLNSVQAWLRLARHLDVDLSASWLVLPPAARCPAEVQSLFRGCLPAAPSLARALARIKRATRASRVLTDFDQAGRICDALRLRGKRIVFTNGVFDLFHLGHLRLLEAARALGEALVVGVNSDSSARRLKGKGRPIVPQFARAEIVAGVRGVDLCVVFEQDDPRALLRAVRPDVLAKGSEYRLSGVVGRRLVAGWGGEVVLVPHVSGFSSTALTVRAGGLRSGGKSVQ